MECMPPAACSGPVEPDIGPTSNGREEEMAKGQSAAAVLEESMLHEDYEEFVTLEPSENAMREVRESAAIGEKKVMKAYVVCQDPKIALIPGFISDDEIRQLLDYADAEGAWVPSVVWRGGLPTHRRSDSFMFRSSQNSLIEAIEHRAAKVAGVPVEQVERLNIVRYSPGQFFGAHHDGRHRPSTIFVYLNDVEEGGETRFPKIGVQVKPVKGCAAYWPNLREDGVMDWRLIHQGMPPTTGMKYGMNCFIAKTPRGALNEWPGYENTGELMEPWWSRSSVGVREIRELSLRRLAKEHLTADEFAAAVGEATGETEERAMKLIEVCKVPYFSVIPGFLEVDEVEQLLKACPPQDSDGWQPSHASTDLGTSAYYIVPMDSTYEERLADMLELEGPELVEEMRIERYLPGQFTFERRANPQFRLSVIVYLSDVEDWEDGMTDFKHATFQFRPLKGAALVWSNYTADGNFDDRVRVTEMPISSVTRFQLTCHVRAADA